MEVQSGSESLVVFEVGDSDEIDSIGEVVYRAGTGEVRGLDSKGEGSVIFSEGSVGVDGRDLWCSVELSGVAVTKRADQSRTADRVVRARR